MRIGLGLGIGTQQGGATVDYEAELLAYLNGNTNCGAYDFPLFTTADSTFTSITSHSNTLVSLFSRVFLSIDPTDGGETTTTQQFDATNVPTAGNTTAVMQIKSTNLSTNTFYLTPEIIATTFGNPPTPTFVDGVQQTTNALLRTALTDGATHTIRMTGLPDSSISRTTSGFDGFFRRLVYIDQVAITGADYTAAVAAAEAWVADGA